MLNSYLKCFLVKGMSRRYKRHDDFQDRDVSWSKAFLKPIVRLHGYLRDVHSAAGHHSISLSVTARKSHITHADRVISCEKFRPDCCLNLFDVGCGLLPRSLTHIQCYSKQVHQNKSCKALLCTPHTYSDWSKFLVNKYRIVMYKQFPHPTVSVSSDYCL
jgi:hypothetical protein